MSPIDALLDAIFGDDRPAFYREFEGWLRASRRFLTFAGDNSTKIRAKLRRAADAEGLDDVRAELETAYLLLHEKSFALRYEQYAAAKQRGPDFTVTFKTHTPFNVEVRRLRALELDEAAGDARLAKLSFVLGEKVRQMPPSIPNLLWLVAGGAVVPEELDAAALSLRQAAERKDEALFTRLRFPSAAAFLKSYPRLSGVVFRQPPGFALWLNPIARHPLPPAVARAIERLPVA
jgi:hypothetical protein